MGSVGRDIKDYKLQEELSNPIAFAASTDPDTMYHHEAMRQPDWDKFLKAMEEEVVSHKQRGHWVIRHCRDIPSNTKVLPAVWLMKRKRRIATREIYKWKARLNVHGGKQEKGVHFWETYSPVVLKWFSIRFFLLLSLGTPDRSTSFLPTLRHLWRPLCTWLSPRDSPWQTARIHRSTSSNSSGTCTARNRPAGCGTSSFKRDFEPWNYCSVIGCLNFLEKSTRPDIACDVHQCARFSADPKQSQASCMLSGRHQGQKTHPTA